MQLPYKKRMTYHSKKSVLDHTKLWTLRVFLGVGATRHSRKRGWGDQPDRDPYSVTHNNEIIPAPSPSSSISPLGMLSKCSKLSGE